MLKNGDMVASLDKRYQAYSAHSSGQDKPHPPLCGAYGSIAMTDIVQLLGNDADTLLQHRCTTIAADQLYLPGEDYVTRVMMDNNRPPAVLRNMQTLYNTGRLAKTGYLSILPVDQGIEHSAGASFAANPLYFDPKTSLSWRLKPGVTVWRPPMACWPPCRAATRTVFRSWLSLTTTKP
jgi:hypothetical protein